MAILDVRNESEYAVTQLRVADRSASAYIVELISKQAYGAEMYDSSNESRSFIIEDKEQAENLIKGIQKAIDLGWFD